MKFFHVMESMILIVTTVFCTLLLLKILYNIRSILSWRVNCWFCNSNFWVKFIDRNNWTCPKCDQYNGFTKDGDYNKILTISNDRSSKSPKLFQRSPPKNGLCKMCNINQQLKVTQLANFVPMNEKKFDEEIEYYRTQLEKAYKLCSPCRKVLQTKLHKEKETLLDSKLLESRTPEKYPSNKKQSQVFMNIINTTSKMIATVLVILIIIDCYGSLKKHKNIIHTVHNIFAITQSFLERIYTIVKMETLLYFPSINTIVEKYETWPIKADLFSKINYSTEMNDIVQKALAGFVCFIQIVGHFWSVNKSKTSIIIDIQWATFIIISISSKYFTRNALILDLIKLLIICTILLAYRNMNIKTGKNVTRRHITPKKITKQCVQNLTNMAIDDEDNISLDTDDDVSLSKFGLHNLTESSSENNSSLKKDLTSGRSFTPRNSSLWNKPKLNSTFCVNSMIGSNSSTLTESVFVKPSFNKYQKLCKDDSDSDLDESISSLCISSPKKKNSKVNPVFALRKFTASPNFIAPSPMYRSRPLISPSKLGHGTSWVAGGYWGSENDRQTFNINGSRSSSQSSGFESQGSSMNQRNIFSQPSSREESVCGETERTVMLDRFQNFNMSNYNYQSPSSFAPINSPVFPPMHYNSHVQIPQPRFPQQRFVSQTFSQQQYIPNSTLQAPGGSKLIKLPQESFMSQCSTASQF